MENTMGIRHGAGTMALGHEAERGQDWVAEAEKAIARNEVREYGWAADDGAAERDWTAETSWQASAVKTAGNERRLIGIMAEVRLYPVYTRHLDEVLQVQEAADRVIRKYGEENPDEKIQAIRRVRGRLAKIADILMGCLGDVAYVNGQDRELMMRAAEFLEKHPQT